MLFSKLFEKVREIIIRLFLSKIYFWKRTPRQKARGQKTGAESWSPKILDKGHIVNVKVISISMGKLEKEKKT